MKQFLCIFVAVVMNSAVFFTVAEEKTTFVVAKKKHQRPSPSKLKEEIGDSYGRIIEKSSLVVAKMTQTTRAAVHQTRKLLADECDPTLEQLQKHRDDLALIEKKLTSFESDACSMLDCLDDGLPTRSSSKIS